MVARTSFLPIILMSFVLEQHTLADERAPEGVVQVPNRSLSPQIGKAARRIPGRPVTPTRQNHGPDYPGQRVWQLGHWSHEIRGGRYGWWWDTGEIGYLYASPSEGPPEYVSEIEQPKQDLPKPTTAAPPEAKERPRAYYFKPGEIKGVPYPSLEQCSKAYEQAGNVGVCVLK
jgi:hypothetical protein